MTGMWLSQMACNVVLVAAIGYLWWNRRSARKEDKLTAYLNVLESRATQLDDETLRYKERCETQLKALARICESARTILERGRWQHSLYPTLEEEELKEAAQITGAETPREIPGNPPPARLDTGLDLKSLLKDQLA